MRLAALAVVVALLGAGAFQPPATVVGCLTDALSQPLHAGWVTIIGASVERRAVADAQGCYEVRDLTAGTYTVRAALPGFCDGVRKDLAVQPGEVATVNFSLVVAPILDEGISYPWTGWPDVARRTDAIVYLRVEQILDTHAWPSHNCGSYISTEVLASIISMARAPQAAGTTGGRLRFLWSPSPLWPGTPRMAVGDRFVAFLQWMPSAGRLMATNAGLMVPVRDERLSWVVGDDRSSDGRDVGTFLTEMRRLPGRITP